MARINSPVDQTDKPKISRSDVVTFFEDRSRRIAELGPLRAVIYQDKHPDLAERRDRAEKARIYPLLGLTGSERILDLGCGSGRWAEELAGHIGHYCGIDISEGLIEYARTRFHDALNMHFAVGTVDNFTLAALGESEPFDRILCSGVLIYLNDEEMECALSCIAAASAKDAILLFREPLALRTRLTLLQHYSEELEHEYNAIYRTQAEIEVAITKVLSDDFKIIESGDVYPDEMLNNRIETRQRWIKVVRRGFR